MLKEIFEQPKSILDTMRGRLLVDEGIIKMAGIWDHLERLKMPKESSLLLVVHLGMQVLSENILLKNLQEFL
jgi:hypothetical protein